MKPATKSLTIGIAMLAVLTALTFAGVIWQIDHVAKNNAVRRLQTADAVVSQLQADRLKEIQLQAEGLAHDTAFVDYVAQSLVPSAQLGGAVDSASISDLLLERRKGYDVAIVLDPQGKPVATSGILLRGPADIQNDPLIAKAISARSPIEGLWVYQGEPLWVSINPLMRGRTMQGVLLAATHIDKAFVEAVSRATDTDAAVVLRPTSRSGPAPATKMDGWVSGALSVRLPEVLSMKEPQSMELNDAENSTLIWVHPLHATSESAAIVLVDQAAKRTFITSEAIPFLAGVAVLFVLGLLVVLLQWKRTWLPLTNMLEFIDRIGNGDRKVTIRVAGSSIVRRLRDGINRIVDRDLSSRR